MNLSRSKANHPRPRQQLPVRLLKKMNVSVSCSDKLSIYVILEAQSELSELETEAAEAPLAEQEKTNAKRKSTGRGSASKKAKTS